MEITPQLRLFSPNWTIGWIIQSFPWVLPSLDDHTPILKDRRTHAWRIIDVATALFLPALRQAPGEQASGLPFVVRPSASFRTGSSAHSKARV